MIKRFPLLRPGCLRTVPLVALFCALATTARADEPTGHGGDETALLLVRLFERINRLGTTVLIASDDIAFASRFAHRRFHLDHGMLVDPDAPAVQ